MNILALHRRTNDRKLTGYRIFLKLKKLYQLVPRRKRDPRIVFIVGCQRSGTTLMTRIFNRDLNARVYNSFSVLSSEDPRKLRLNPLPMVRSEILKNRLPLVVFKPIVESQNTLDMLDFFTNARAIWMFRNYRDVVSSNIRRFGSGNGVRDIAPLVERRPDNWRSQKVSDETRRLVKAHFRPGMNDQDAAALFWYSRNVLFFEQRLEGDPRVLLCKYDDLVTSPARVMQRIYRFAGVPYPGGRIVAEVKPSSVGKGKGVALAPEIETLCQALYLRMEQVHEDQILKAGA